MNLFTIEGFLGDGKTLGMSILAKYYQEKSGCTLYSNYGLAGSKPFTKLEDFFDVAVQPSSIICLDEAHVDLDARNFSTNAVKFFTSIIFYLRKMRCTIYFTSPLVENLDMRVRGITNIHCRAMKTKDYFYYFMSDMQSGRQLKTLKIQKEKAFQVASKIFETNSMVTPLEYPEERKQFLTFLSELKAISDSYYVRGSAGQP